MTLHTRVTPTAQPDAVSALIAVAHACAERLASGEVLQPALLSRLMTEAHGGSDAGGAWVWRQAYDATEAAQAIAFIRADAGGLRGDPAGLLALARAIAARCPTQSRRSEAQLRLQQFSTPLALAVVVAAACQVRPGEIALEPSCGTGLIAAALRVMGADLALNELDPGRAALAAAALGVDVSRHDAAFIDDLFDFGTSPTLVAMNPPFSSSAARTADPEIAGRHLVSALKRLSPGGRLVAIMPAGFSESGSSRTPWREARDRAALRLRLALPGDAFRQHGTTVETALVVYDKADVNEGPKQGEAATLEEALAQVLDCSRFQYAAPPASPSPAARLARSAPALARPAASPPPAASLVIRREQPTPLDYAAAEKATGGGAEGATGGGTAGDEATGGLYAPYRVARIAIPGAAGHPTPLVESAAMAAITPPAPTHRPLLALSLIRRGALSDAQLETLVYAGEAFSQDLPGAVRIDPEWRQAVAAPEGDPEAVRLRRGFFLGDGTGCGKGRQVAGMILDAFNAGARRAVWVSKSDKLIEDAVRDWTALGGDASDIRPLGKWKLGETIRFEAGVLFVTYGLLRVGPRQGKAGRLEQIVDWLGEQFEGVIAFDEAHAMGGAGGGDSPRGVKKGSQQGVAGLRLQLAVPRARVAYVSATGATTIENLAYAERLGLWGVGPDYPFPSRAAFVEAMTAGGVAAMEIVARDLKALGLYAARALSFDGVDYEILEHALTPEQVALYDAYADAFQIIHANLARAMEATGLMRDGVVQDAQARSAALSRFESLKQRFFNHLLTGLKTPAMLRDVERRLTEGMSVVIQIVSTGEALLDRRLDALPEAEREDLAIDLTPKDAIVEYLRAAFPTELRRTCEDDNGNLHTEIVRDEDGHAVESREAMALRDAMIENLCLLAPVQTALDQIVWRFGTDAVAEATGRTRRIVRVTDATGGSRLRVERRAASANTAETTAFMQGAKRILVFSEAGGTGRSYHADRDAANGARRLHYLLEAGWRADVAIQGLGRTHRSNQSSAPLFVPVTTDVKGEKRFISTISRRLDSLGALTKGAAKTGGQNLFRPEDNLESDIARSALRAFYAAIVNGAATSVTLEDFEATTGLKLIAEDGALLEDLPPITRFMNRILALRIAAQNAIFEEFTEIIAGRVAAAEKAGRLDLGAEHLVADSLKVLDRQTLRTCPATGAETLAWRLAVSTRLDRPSFAAMRARWGEAAELLVNARSGGVAFSTPYASHYGDDGAITPQLRLIRPRGREVMTRAAFAESAWEPCAPERFAALWDAAVAALPELETEELALVSGLILPVWRRLPKDEPRIRRLTTDCGQRLIGRIVGLDQLGDLADALRPLDPDSPASVARAVMIENRTVALMHGVRLRRRLVGGRQRCEIEGATAGMVPSLKAVGCFVEIIQYQARVFAPLDMDMKPEGIAAIRGVLALLPVLEAGAAA
jgi:hypothetical protein